MTILITGASGFLGSALTRVLVAQEQPVRILVRRTSYITHLEGLPVDIVYGSLNEPDSLVTACRNVHTIYHCAGLSADWGAWQDFYQANVLGTRNLLAAAVAAKTVERFLHVSTSDVYGYPRVACDETHPIVDCGLPYNRSKGLGEREVWASATVTGLPVTVVRPVSIYGPRSRDFVAEIVTLLRQRQMLYVDGGRTHAGLLYIHNAVEGLIRAATTPQAVGQVYNLRDPGDETWADYVGALAAGLGVRAPWINLPAWLALALATLFETGARGLRLKRRPLLTRHATYLMCRDQGYSIAKGQRELDLHPSISFAQGIEHTLAWLAVEMPGTFPHD